VVVNTAVAILAVVVMIVRFKLNPVVSLVVGSAYLGLAVGLGVEGTIKAITGGFGEIMADVGLLIAFGVLMGAILQQTGAIQRLVEMLLRVFGPKRMPYALSLTIATALQSIFLDVLLVISAPLARNLAKRIGKNGLPRIATAMAISLECGIVLMVPGVASLALAGLLGVPLGKMLLFGFCLVIPTVAISVAIMSFLFNHGWWDADRDESPFLGEEPTIDEPSTDDASPQGTTASAAGSGSVAVQTPSATRAHTSLLLLFAPMLTSLLLIATGAILDAADIHNPIVTFLSSPVIALLIGLIGTSFVGRYALGAEPIHKAFATGFKESGQILILTGVGGSLAATIKAAGLGKILGEYFTANTAAPLLMVWIIAAALHVAVGSVTISAITSAGILAPVVPLLGLDPVLVALAAGARAVHPRSTENRHGRSVGGLRGGDPAHPARQPVVLIGDAD
jgi:H+/gluconate symporter-like permease